MTDDTAEFLTKALNAHGIFFKRKVREILDGCRTTTGSIGESIVAIVGEAYPVHYLQGAPIDLLAEVRLGRERRLELPIECNRAYSDRRRWVFFRDADTRARFIVGISGRKVEFTQASAYNGFGDNICVEGVEIDLGARDQYKPASPDRI